jgi:hypothetical protein
MCAGLGVEPVVALLACRQPATEASLSRVTCCLLPIAEKYEARKREREAREERRPAGRGWLLEPPLASRVDRSEPLLPIGFFKTATAMGISS